MLNKHKLHSEDYLIMYTVILFMLILLSTESSKDIKMVKWECVVKRITIIPHPLLSNNYAIYYVQPINQDTIVELHSEFIPNIQENDTLTFIR